MNRKHIIAVILIIIAYFAFFGSHEPASHVEIIFLDKEGNVIADSYVNLTLSFDPIDKDNMPAMQERFELKTNSDGRVNITEDLVPSGYVIPKMLAVTAECGESLKLIRFRTYEGMEPIEIVFGRRSDDHRFGMELDNGI